MARLSEPIPKVTAPVADPWGRFTARGSAEVESFLTSLVSEVAEKSRLVLDDGDFRALVLTGGYGRGEGGVTIVDGRERPHNNLDFLVITNNLPASSRENIVNRFRDIVSPIGKQYGVEVELSATTVSTLRWAPSLIMWYDMRHGHKTIRGDAGFVPSLKHLRADRIPDWDVRNLIVNRGSALVVNQRFIETKTLDPAARKLIVKQAMKAVIAYGDALLFMLGEYHWSYLEKQRRMQSRRDVAPDFQRLYDEAMEFRFLPQYDEYITRDLARWMSDLYAMLMPLHMTWESRRLAAPGFRWEDYPDLLLRKALVNDPRSVRAWAKKALHAVHSRSYPAPAPLTARLGYRTLSPRDVFTLTFPTVGYQLESAQLRALAEALLGASCADLSELRRAYLQLWHRIGDPGFAYVIRRWKTLLEPFTAS